MCVSNDVSFPSSHTGFINVNGVKLKRVSPTSSPKRFLQNPLSQKRIDWQPSRTSPPSTSSIYRSFVVWSGAMIRSFIRRRDGFSTMSWTGSWAEFWNLRTRWSCWSFQNFIILMIFCLTSNWHLWVLKNMYFYKVKTLLLLKETILFTWV